jgi:type II secretory pathway pseudopilin PulG
VRAALRPFRLGAGAPSHVPRFAGQEKFSSSLYSSADAGTTLVEALAALAITSLVALIGFPRLQQALIGASQRQTVAVVAAQLRQVRTAALRTDRPQALAVFADGGGFAALGATSTVRPGLRLSSGSGRAIAFYGDGSSPGGVIWVTAGGRSLPVTVAPVTGAISVAER